jgi:O-acetyl-ADP-ribose deacetylase (regulator of RNase III)
MKRVNAIQIETVWGYKTFELYQGDITNLDFGVDVLAVSALRGNYYPKKGTVVGALFENHQINLQNLKEDCEFDLRKPFSCWVSKEIPNPKFKRILCVEMLDPSFTTEEVIKNVFVTLSILEAKGISVQKFASPLLGTGTLSLDPGLVIKTLLDNSLEYLKRAQNLKEIKFVAYDENLAEQLKKAMNEVLNRVTIAVING